MTLFLGAIVRNEQDMLSRVLPVWKRAKFDGWIALDTGSVDATGPLLASSGFIVQHALWRSHFALARNQLLDTARRLDSNGWLLMLDADEALFPHDVDKLRALCASTKRDVITFPRYNLAKGGAIHSYGTYPDKQARCIRLSAPVEFRNAVHEVACYRGQSANIPGQQLDHFAKDIHIYHYGLCKPPAQNWLRSHNYGQIARMMPEVKEAPEEVQRMAEEDFLKSINHQFKPFDEPHPLKGAI